MTLLALFFLASTYAPLGGAIPVTHTLTGAGMTAQVMVRNDTMEVHIEAPGPGWVVFGLGEQSGINNAQLVMVAAQPDGSTRFEHHVTEPPKHHAIASQWIQSAVAVDGKNTVVDLVLDLSNQPVSFAADQTVFVTLAWSRSDDFGHHSAQRTEATFRW